MLHPLLERHRQQASMASSLGTVRSRLLWCARELSPYVLGAGTSPEVWRALGVRVVRRDLGALRGLLHPLAGTPVVEVNRLDHPRVQRFTAAHELAHVVLGEVDRARVGLDSAREEQLCDAFASHLLIPRNDLAERLRGVAAPEELVALLPRYDVGLGAYLRAAGEQLADCELLVFAASRRGHPRRPQELAHRAFGTLGGAYLVPEHRRLTSLGLGELECALDSGEPRIAGEATKVQLQLWRPGAVRRSGVASGTAAWSALQLGTGLTVIVLRTSALKQHWARSRASVAA